MTADDCDPPPQFFGKYRGKVLENVDPMDLGRILVDVPAVPSAKLSLAWPCFPYSGEQVGLYFIPPLGANVWVEFEGGDPNHPIWTGCFWAEAELPAPAGLPGVAVLRMLNMTVIASEEEGLTIEVVAPGLPDPMTLAFNATGIEISVPPSVVRLGPATLEVVCGASTVTLTEAEGIDVAAEGPVAVASPDVNVTANVSIEGAIEAEGNVEVTGATELIGNLDVTGNLEVEAVDIALTAAATEITSADIALTGAAVEMTAAGIVMTGAAEVNGDLLIDGQQPLVI